ncbi:hypothetical protein P4S72_25275 [Vibrio sp. PP-XX7]
MNYRKMCSSDIYNNVKVIYANYGIKSNAYKWDDFAEIELKGKVVIVKDGTPSIFRNINSKKNTYHGRWTYKCKEATLRGAVGVIILHEESSSNISMSTIRNTISEESFYLFSKLNKRELPNFIIWLDKDCFLDFTNESSELYNLNSMNLEDIYFSSYIDCSVKT